MILGWPPSKLMSGDPDFQPVSDKKTFMGIFHRVLCWIKFGCGGHLGLCSEMWDTIFHWDNCNQIFVEWSLDGPLPNLCPVIPTSNQDGHQAKNRKRGDEIRRRFLCEFPIGSYVKLSLAVGAILIEGLNRQIHFWKRTIQWLFHQNHWANCNQTLVEWSSDGPLPKLCPGFQTSDQDGRHSRT
jgi:hypothetical protein